MWTEKEIKRMLEIFGFEMTKESVWLWFSSVLSITQDAAVIEYLLKREHLLKTLLEVSEKAKDG